MGPGWGGEPLSLAQITSFPEAEATGRAACARGSSQCLGKPTAPGAALGACSPAAKAQGPDLE